MRRPPTGGDAMASLGTTSITLRKVLQRARAAFADALVDEVAHSLGGPAIEPLEQELISLDLLDHCRSALERRRGLRGG